MIINEDQGQGHYKIRSYEAGAITINEQTYRTSLLVSAHKLVENWGPTDAKSLTKEDVAPILSLEPVIVLLGTGQTFIIPPASFLDAIRAKGIGIEFMDTSAACRTFIALTAEGRSVVAALIL